MLGLGFKTTTIPDGVSLLLLLGQEIDTDEGVDEKAK